MLDMPGLTAADNELITFRLKPLTDIAKTKIVISFGILAYEAKTKKNSALGTDFCQAYSHIHGVLNMFQMEFYYALSVFHIQDMWLLSGVLHGSFNQWNHCNGLFPTALPDSID